MNSKNIAENNSLTGKILVSAIISFLVLVLVYFPFIMPWKLWIKSTQNIAKLHNQSGILKTVQENDFPFFTWYRYAMDGLTFFSYIAGPVLVVIWSINHDLNGLIYSFLFFYFAPVMLTILKELFGWFPYQANKTKEIANNTQNK